MKIVVNGCFDLLHDGHKYMLAKALSWSNHGSVLVPINTDESIRSLKGLTRPIQNLDTRIQQVRSFIHNWYSACMEYPHHEIVPFDTESELAKIIDNFEPDIILKGNDRTDVKEIIGSDKWPVCILPRLRDKNGRDISTTNMLDINLFLE